MARNIARLHKKEWERQREFLEGALLSGDAEQVKLAKVAAEALKIKQEGERRAWEADAAENGRYVIQWKE